MEHSQIASFLQNGADANTKDKNGFTLLMSFSQKCDLLSVSDLLRYGASVSMIDNLGYTALDYAIKVDCLEVVEYLVEHGAVVTADSYMLAVRKDKKTIVSYFDSLDADKQVFLKKKRTR